jgi:hypothetical protein
VAAAAYALLRDAENLAATADTIQRYSPARFGVEANSHRALAAALIGDTARALRLLGTFVDTRGTETSAARVYAMLGDTERALDYLELAFQRNTDFLGSVLYPWFDHIRGHPRYIALAQRYRIPLRLERLD